MFELLTQQYEMARIEEAKDVPAVSVIDPPGMAERKSFPPRLLLTLLLDFLSFACAAALILVRDHWSTIAPSDPAKSSRLKLFRYCASRIRSDPCAKARCRMRKHLTNAALRRSGLCLVSPWDAAGGAYRSAQARRVGVRLWMIATAVISAGGIIASGFCDANIQRVAHLRGTGKSPRCRNSSQHAGHQPGAGLHASGCCVDSCSICRSPHRVPTLHRQGSA